jgi:hypothetical protein
MSNTPKMQDVAISAQTANEGVADLRAQIVDLVSIVRMQHEHIATLADRALAPKTRAPRAPKAIPAPLSEVERACAAAHFRSKDMRGRLFSYLVARGVGEYTLVEVAAGSINSEGNVRALEDLLTVARNVSRRLGRDKIKNAGYLLDVDAYTPVGDSLLTLYKRPADYVGTTSGTDTIVDSAE